MFSGHCLSVHLTPSDGHLSFTLPVSNHIAWRSDFAEGHTV